MQESVRISDGVVVGVDKLLSVLLLHLRGIVWLEESGVARIAVMVVEVGTIAVKNNELLVAPLVQHLVQHRYHLRVGSVYTVFRVFLYEFPFVSLLSEEVDKRMVRLLVGDKHRVEPGFLEGFNDSLLPVYPVVVYG